MESKLKGIEDKASDILERLGKITNGSDGNQNVVQVQFGPASITSWVLGIALVIVVTLSGVMFLNYLDLSRKIDRMQDHLTAIYMMAPSLQPHPKDKE